MKRQVLATKSKMNLNPRKKFIIELIVTLISIFAVIISTISIVRTLKEDDIAKTLRERFNQVLSGYSLTDNFLPGPLSRIDPSKQEETELTRDEVIDRTNLERASEGLPALTMNVELSTSAERKVDDMFTNQYFEHMSPDGQDISDLAKEADYAYVFVGENLALGNFTDSADIVTAWMNSPGHRANIMNTRYIEIGVSVKNGIYQGQEVWIGVQHFGEPLSVCGSIDSRLKATIDAEKGDLVTKEANIIADKEVIESMDDNEPGYESRIDSYNQEVSDYNLLADKLKNSITTYNAQVNSFNTCVQSGH